MEPTCCCNDSNDEPCSNPPVVLDTEYDEYYCKKHAKEYEVYDGPFKEL